MNELIPAIVPKRRSINGPQWLVLAFGGIVLVGAAIGITVAQRDDASKAAAEVKRLANLTGDEKLDFDAWTSLLADPSRGKINDPGSFQKHCGQPTMRVTRPTYFALLYSEHNLTVMFMRRKLGTTKQELARGGTFLAFDDQAFFNQISPERFVSTESALKTLGCTAPPKV